MFSFILLVFSACAQLKQYICKIFCLLFLYSSQEINNLFMMYIYVLYPKEEARKNQSSLCTSPVNYVLLSLSLSHHFLRYLKPFTLTYSLDTSLNIAIYYLLITICKTFMKYFVFPLCHILFEKKIILKMSHEEWYLMFTRKNDISNI